VERGQHIDADRLARCTGCLGWFCKLILILTGKRGGDECVYIPERIINRPDPCIYDQFLLMQLGLPVTWDNPDVAIFLNGIEQYTYDLRVNTEYDVLITVHNTSREKPALGTLVDVGWVEFGAGGQVVARHPIALVNTDVPLWPGTSVVAVKWTTPANEGHYCIDVVLSHPDDGNPSNNRGWNNTQVKAAASEVRTAIRVFNQWPRGCPPVHEGGDAVSWWRVWLGYALLAFVAAPIIGTLMRGDLTRRQQFLLMIAGYFAGALLGLIFETIRAAVGRRRTRNQKKPDRWPCELVEITVDSYRFNDGVGKQFDPLQVFAGRPAAWPARVEPNMFGFAPNEVFRDVTLIVDAPDGPGQPEVFNVNVRQGGMPSGGATITVTRKGA